ncbi:MAG: hypothetical protein ACK58L_18185, partial [Planctomycetota bacterium]
SCPLQDGTTHPEANTVPGKHTPSDSADADPASPLISSRQAARITPIRWLTCIASFRKDLGHRR